MKQLLVATARTYSPLKPYFAIMRWHKPTGCLLLLWPTLWALWIAAHGLPPWPVLLSFILGVVLMRSAGCVINDIADRKIDGAVSRTKERPLVTQTLTTQQALLLFLGLCFLALIVVLQLNTFTIELSVAALLLAAIYPFSKRAIHFPQFILGLAFAWSVPMAFGAVQNNLPSITWFIYAIAVLWPIAYDSIYALMDREDDLKIGVKSFVILLGRHDVCVIFLLQAMVLASLCWLGCLLEMRKCYFFALALASIMVAYQYHLVRQKDYLKAFCNNQWVGLAIFIGIFINYL